MLERFHQPGPKKPAKSPATSRQELEARVIAKAWKDPEFKKRLLADPRSIISQELGADLPAGLQVSALEETPQTYYLLVPMKPPGAETCSLEELQTRAAGDDLNSLVKDAPSPS